MTTLVVTLSPNDKDFQANRRTLQFAQSAQKVKVKACRPGRGIKRRRGADDEGVPIRQWQQLQQENEKLKRENAELYQALQATKGAPEREVGTQVAELVPALGCKPAAPTAKNVKMVEAGHSIEGGEKAHERHEKALSASIAKRQDE